MLKYFIHSIFKHQRNTASHRFQMEIAVWFKTEGPKMKVLAGESMNRGLFQLLRTGESRLEPALAGEGHTRRRSASRWRVFFRIALPKRDFHGPARCSVMP